MSQAVMSNMHGASGWSTQLQASSRPQSTSRRTPVLMLTRRGRFVLFLVAVTMLAALMLVGGRAVGNILGGPTPVQQSMTVEPGQTLWSIAQGIAKPNQDVRDIVAELQSLNKLPDGGVQAGQYLILPGN